MGNKNDLGRLMLIKNKLLKGNKLGGCKDNPKKKTIRAVSGLNVVKK